MLAVVFTQGVLLVWWKRLIWLLVMSVDHSHFFVLVKELGKNPLDPEALRVSYATKLHKDEGVVE